MMTSKKVAAAAIRAGATAAAAAAPAIGASTFLYLLGAIHPKARMPRVDDPPLRIVRLSGPALTTGVQTHSVEGVPVHVYSPAKTVADCFKYRNKIGMDVALEALRDCFRRRKATADEIWIAAKACRMTNVMRPYLEATA